MFWCWIRNISRELGQDHSYSRWRHQIETWSALLALCARNSLVTSEFPSQSPVTRSFDIFFDLPLNKRLSKQSQRQWFKTPSRSLWRHCNDLSADKLSWRMRVKSVGTKVPQQNYQEFNHKEHIQIKYHLKSKSFHWIKHNIVCKISAFIIFKHPSVKRRHRQIAAPSISELKHPWHQSQCTKVVFSWTTLVLSRDLPQSRAFEYVVNGPTLQCRSEIPSSRQPTAQCW